MKVIAIAAVSKNGVIGNGNNLPWHIPEDMKFFREATKNQIVIMGRKTFESLGKPLPQRQNAVISRNPTRVGQETQHQNVKFFADLKASLSYFFSLTSQDQDKNIFIIGGAEIYRLSLDVIDELWLTEIENNVDGDVYFPDYQDGKFMDHRFLLVSSSMQNDLSSEYRYRFNVYRRKK
jgi:dihydrofolate reductase